MLHFRIMRTILEKLHCWLKGQLSKRLLLKQKSSNGLPPRIGTTYSPTLMIPTRTWWKNSMQMPLLKERSSNVGLEEKSFSVKPVYLAEILHINWPMFNKPPAYDDLNPNEEVLREALRDSLKFSPNGKLVSVASLSPELRLLTMLMFHNLYPLSSTGYMNLGRALFLHDLITNEEIDVCSHICHILAKTTEWTASRNCIPFCRLFSKILKLKGIYPSEDEYPYPLPSPINIHTLNASISHTKKSTKQESHATSHAYDEKLDNIMATIQEINTKISGLTTIMTKRGRWSLIGGV